MKQNLTFSTQLNIAHPLSTLAALPGAIVTRDVTGAVMAVLFRGEHAGEQDISGAENDAMQTAALKQHDD